MRNGAETIPVIGPWFSTAGGVMDLWAMPCFPRFDLFAVAAAWNLPRLWWDIVKPSPGNEVRALLRGASHGHLKEKQPLKPKISWTNPSIVEGIGFASFLDGIAESAGQKFSIAVTGEVGFYITIANALADFSLAWITTAYQMGGCLPSSAGPTRLTAGEGTLRSGFGAESTIFSDVEGDPTLNAVDGIIVPAGLDFSVGANTKTKPWPIVPGQFQSVRSWIQTSPDGIIHKQLRRVGPGAPSKSNENFGHVKLPMVNYPRKVSLITEGATDGYCLLDGSSLTAGESHLVASQFKWDP